MTQIERDPNQDGRSRRKNEAMRAVQSAALRLFSKRGFAEVTVEEIAAKAGVGPATVYRNFGSKERILLWDEYDPVLFRCIGEHLRVARPLDAIRDGFIQALDEIYRRDAARILRRARLIRSTPSVLAAAAADMANLGQGLAELLAPVLHNDFRRRIMAVAVVGALNASIDRWIDEKGKTPLRKILKKAFGELGSLAS